MANNKGNLDESISSDSDLEIIEEIPAPKKQKSGKTALNPSSLHCSSQNGNTVIWSDDLVEYKQLVNGLNHRHRHTSTNSESDMAPQDGQDQGRNGNGNTTNIVITPKPTFAEGQSSKLPEAEAGRFQTGFCPPTAPAITPDTVAAPSLSTLSPSVPSSLDVDKIKKSVRAQPEFAQYSTSNGDGGQSNNGRSVARKSCSRIYPQRRPVSFMSTGAPTVKNYGNQSPQVSSSQELFRNPWRQTSSGVTPKTPSKKARNRRVIETSSSSSDGSSASDDDSETGSSSSSTASSTSGSESTTSSSGSDSDSSTDSENKPGAVSLQGQAQGSLDAGNNTSQVISTTSSELNVSTATAIRVVSRRTETETVAVTDTGIETVTLIQTVTETETETEQSVITTGTGTGNTTTSSTTNKKHKKKIRRESRHDVEVVDLFEDDDDEMQKYAGIGPIDMICHACAKPRLFKMKPAFIQHHRRHLSRDHFQCPTPTCLRGFTSLTLCTDHEEKAHNKKKVPTATSSAHHQSKVEGQEGQGQERSTMLAPPPAPCSISATTTGNDMDSDTASAVSSVATIRINYTENQTNNRDGEFEWSDEYTHLDEYIAPAPAPGASSSSGTNNNQINKKKTRIVPSTMLTRYRGQPVRHMTECTDIEEKHGLRNRTLGAMGPIQQQIQAIRNLTFDEEHDYFG